MLTDMQAWLSALLDNLGERYAGDEQLMPIMGRYFDLLWDADTHPYGDEQLPDQLSWFLEDK